MLRITRLDKNVHEVKLKIEGRIASDWVAEVVSERAVIEAGVFDPHAVDRLWRKCVDHGADGQFSNADNMALVGVLSTGLLHERLVRAASVTPPADHFGTEIDCMGRDAQQSPTALAPTRQPA